MKTTKKIYNIASIIGYINGLREGKESGSISKDILKEGEMFSVLMCNLLQNPNIPEETKKAIGEYLNIRDKQIDTIEDFCMEMLAMIKGEE